MSAARTGVGGPDLGPLAVLGGAILLVGPVLGTVEAGVVSGSLGAWTFQVPNAAFRMLPSLAAAGFGWAIAAEPRARPPRWAGFLVVALGLGFTGLGLGLAVSLPGLLDQVLEPAYRRLLGGGALRGAAGLAFLGVTHLAIGWRIAAVPGAGSPGRRLDRTTRHQKAGLGGEG